MRRFWGEKLRGHHFWKYLRKNMMGGALLIVALVNTHTNRKEFVHSMEADTAGANTMVEHLEAVPIDASSGTCKNEGDFCVGNHCVKVPCKNEPRRLSPCTPCTDPSHHLFAARGRGDAGVCSSREPELWARRARRRLVRVPALMDRNNVGEESPVRHVSMLTSSDCCLRPRMRSDGGMHVGASTHPIEKP